MIQAIVIRNIEASYDEVWPLLSDITKVVDYHPSVSSVDLVTSNKEGVGATRVCHFFDGTSLKETVTEADAKHLKLQLSEFTVPLKEFEAEMNAKVISERVTEVTFQFTFTVKYGPLGYLMGVTLIKPQMKKMGASVLLGLDDHIHGRPVKKVGNM
jgi:carbon monoxide dehydrogenase subunit G